MNNFHSLEVVDRDSETQLQVDENLDWIIWRLKGSSADIFLQTKTPKVFASFEISINVLVI